MSSMKTSRADALPPAISPDFNPLKNTFAKLKVIPRKAAARTIRELWDTIRDAFRASPHMNAPITLSGRV